MLIDAFLPVMLSQCYMPLSVKSLHYIVLCRIWLWYACDDAWCSTYWYRLFQWKEKEQSYCS